MIASGDLSRNFEWHGHNGKVNKNKILEHLNRPKTKKYFNYLDAVYCNYKKKSNYVNGDDDNSEIPCEERLSVHPTDSINTSRNDDNCSERQPEQVPLVNTIDSPMSDSNKSDSNIQSPCKADTESNAISYQEEVELRETCESVAAKTKTTNIDNIVNSCDFSLENPEEPVEAEDLLYEPPRKKRKRNLKVIRVVKNNEQDTSAIELGVAAFEKIYEPLDKNEKPNIKYLLTQEVLEDYPNKSKININILEYTFTLNREKLDAILSYVSEGNGQKDECLIFSTPENIENITTFVL